jgi:D-alanyl-D-alanine carboxypeptidase/Choline-binding repeat
VKKFVLIFGLLLVWGVPSFTAIQSAAEEEVVTKNGWVLEENNWYYYSNNSKETGWIKPSGTWYYLHPDTGIMQTGWVLWNNKWYFLDESGAMKTGWIYSLNKWYYLDQSGAMKTGWIYYFNDWYYLNPYGDMRTGWLYYLNNWYFLNPDGDMATGWFVDKGKYYYAYSSGAMAYGKRIDGYYVGYSGQWIEDTTSPYYLKDVLLVNKRHGLPSSYASGENVQARAAFEQMKKAAAIQGLTLHIASGYRSYEYQKNLYWRYVSIYGQAQADRFSAYPGYSEHQTGLAFDIGGSNSSLWVSSGFDHTAEAKWLAKNAHHYGFILRYPPGKEHITGYMYESWHFRYLGVDVASKVFSSGLTLEEYLGEF